MCYIEPVPQFQKAVYVVTGITNAWPAQVTTNQEHNYITDMYVRLQIPDGFGMRELDHQQFRIIVNSPTTFFIDADTINYATFNIPVGARQCAQVVPIGAYKTLYAATRNMLPPSTGS